MPDVYRARCRKFSSKVRCRMVRDAALRAAPHHEGNLNGELGAVALDVLIVAK